MSLKTAAVMIVVVIAALFLYFSIVQPAVIKAKLA